MNSFNHYAYGSVADWVYQKAAGIHTAEDAPGYAFIRFAPVPDARLSWLTASLQTRHGLVESGWRQEDGKWRYEITTPSMPKSALTKIHRRSQPGTISFTVRCSHRFTALHFIIEHAIMKFLLINKTTYDISDSIKKRL